MSQSNFEQYLKNSDYFSDVINTHRRATAEVLSVLVTLMRDHANVPRPVIDDSFKRLSELPGGRSVVDERRLLIDLIRDNQLLKCRYIQVSVVEKTLE